MLNQFQFDFLAEYLRDEDEHMPERMLKIRPKIQKEKDASSLDILNVEAAYLLGIHDALAISGADEAKLKTVFPELY
jgi:hypothetical protein